MGRRRRKRHACMGWAPTVNAGGIGHTRTESMRNMVVTLEASKLSGWLNTDAYCRVERRAYDAGRDPGQEAGGAVGRLRGTRRAHLKHILHGCDLGRVEA